MNKDLQVNNPVYDIDGEEAGREDDPGNKIVSDSEFRTVRTLIFCQSETQSSAAHSDC